MSINPMLLCDFYKTTHSRQFPKGTTELTSYFTPRMSRLTDINSMESAIESLQSAMDSLDYAIADLDESVSEAVSALEEASA